LVGGNYAVGGRVHGAVIHNFVVITKGAGRLYEVSARSPWTHARRQMAIR